jgi:tetratricopeptide (TPR) repeat protein
VTSKRQVKLAYVLSAAIMLAGAAVALTLLAPRRDEVSTADRLRSEGRYAEALDLYQDTLAKDPTNEEALWGVAATHLARQDPPSALDYLNRYLRRYPRGRHSTEARSALGKLRGAYVENRKPSPELNPGTPPAMPAGPPREIEAAWEQAEKLERHGQLLDAVAAYAAVGESAADGVTRGAAFERMARCEARRPPFDYERVRHFYLRAQRAYREAADAQDADRCQQLAYLAQEYARVEGEREKLAEERREVERQARELVPAPGPREAFEEALAAFRAGDDPTALREAGALLDQVPAAWYIVGMVHARQGDWEAARRELDHYVAQEPSTDFAERAREQLALMRDKRPLLVDDFLRSAAKWRLDGEKHDAVPATESLKGPEPSEGPAMRLDPGQGTYTSFDKAEKATLSLRLYVPPADAPPLPRTRWQLYGPDALTCAPLLLTDKGLQFFGGTDKPVSVEPGWHTLTIDVTRSVVSAQVDGRFIGEVAREGPFNGVHVRTNENDEAGPLYLDDVTVVEPLSKGDKPR